MDKDASVFKQTYQSYLDEISGVDLAERAERLGAEISGEGLILPILNRRFRVSSKGVESLEGKRAEFAESVALFKYILMCPRSSPEAPEWVAYREFKDARPLLDYFAHNCIGLIERRFSGKITELKSACEKLGGIVIEDEGGYDLSMLVTGLPKISMLLKFNDGDNEFPARSVLLFQRSTEAYLDMESVAILAVLLAGKLISHLENK